MKKILITICVAVGVYFAFSNTIDEFLYPEKRPGLNTYDTYTTTTQQTTTAVTQQTPIVTDEDGYEPRDDRSLTMFSLQTPHGRKGLLTGRAMTNDIPLKYQ